MKFKNKILIGTSVFLVVIISLLILIGVGVYKYNWQGKIIKILPYPAAIVNNKIIKYSDWQEKIENYQANSNFYLEESEIDLKSLELPSEEELKQKALEDLIKKKILINLAKENKITASEQEIEEAYKDLILSKSKKGEEVIEESLQKIYGLSISQFKEDVIKEYVLRQKLQKNKNNDLKDLAKVKAEEVLKIINEEKLSFSEVARMYSEDALASEGGSLGYIGKKEMTEFYDQAVWSLEVGETSEIVATDASYEPVGYYIIRVDDIKEKEGVTEAKVSHIFIEADIDKLLDEEFKKAKIRRFVN